MENLSMAYNLPQFNLSCDVYTRTTPSVSSRILRIGGQVCQLRAPTRGATGSVAIDPYTTIDLCWSIIFPALTDIRELRKLNSSTVLEYADLVNCPAGTNRWYEVLRVDDAAKGFPNEYRIAVVGKIGNAADASWWAPPYP